MGKRADVAWFPRQEGVGAYLQIAGKNKNGAEKNVRETWGVRIEEGVELY